jgi:AGCS family alanine or glycine:cation symporter
MDPSGRDRGPRPSPPVGSDRNAMGWDGVTAVLLDPGSWVVPWIETLGQAIERLDQGFTTLVERGISPVIFFDAGTGMPALVLWLLLGGLFFTLRLGWINLRGMGHAVAVLRGRYDGDDAVGEVSHFQALSTALSATLGLGNIAGVAIAIHLGGPGAVLWMTLAALLGMSNKFVECTLGQLYRVVRPDGTVAGGPMYYLSQGLAEQGLGRLGRGLALLFSLLCVLSTLGGSTLFQTNQSYRAIATVIPGLAQWDWLYGAILALLVGLVLVGGVQRIGWVTSKLVPLMCGLYVGAALWVLIVHGPEIPAAIATIVRGAISPEAVEGGVVGVLVQGLRRSVFSNEAGIGSAAIAHAASRSGEPVREGIVAMLEPFIDTIVVCNMTALVVIVTGVYQDPALAALGGADLTSAAFGSVISWFPIVLAIAVFCFAVSTIISWGYYGEQGWDYLLGAWGQQNHGLYHLLLLAGVFVGAIADPQAVIEFGDGMMLSMAVPNLLGLYLLSNRVARELRRYRTRLSAGEFDPGSHPNRPLAPAQTLGGDE